ncbi:MAG: glutamine--tRNA ligase/YqeY domain fusion protein [Pseudohongiellaceae bacterium]
MNSPHPENKVSRASSNFIRQKVEQDLAAGKHGGRVHTRFPPEPNGYLHIGHAKSIYLNFSLAEEFNGACNLRFDDTNPAKESQEFVDSIKDNIRWLGFNWNGKVRYASDYFDLLYDFAVQLIENNLAYVCDLSPDQAREYRGTLTEPGRNSPGRDRSVADNRDLFQRMREGEFADGKYSLRARIDMASPNMNMRDPVLYRIRHLHHHQTGDKWCIYPLYDYTHCICDALENITHSLCTLEFEDHRPLYDWILHHLELDSLREASDLGDSGIQYVLPEQTEFARLRLNYTVMSKRKLRELVDGGTVAGWDDPRMPTLSGLRRRGYTAASIRNFCEMVGVTRSDSVVDFGMLEHAVREDLDRVAPRAMCVLNPLKVTIETYDQGQVQQLSMPRHPKMEAMGRRTVPFSRELYIDRSDFEESPPPGFKRLTAGGEVRLRGAYVIKCERMVKNERGETVELICSHDADTLGKSPEGRKVKGVIHWVSVPHALEAEVRLYDRLFSVENPDDKSIANYHDCLNPESLTILKKCFVEPSVAEDENAVPFQFEREGYFLADSDSEGRLVFNRTITLRDSWARQ